MQKILGNVPGWCSENAVGYICVYVCGCSCCQNLKQRQNGMKHMMACWKGPDPDMVPKCDELDLLLLDFKN